jgi:hypothetical protein
MRSGRVGRHVRRVVGCVTVALLAAALPVWAPGAFAGQGWSDDCTDGQTKPGGTEIQILTSPVTFNLEAGDADGTYVQVCYSTTAEGSGSTAVTGGIVEVRVFDDEHVGCHDDDSPTLIGLECRFQDPNPSSIGQTFTASFRVQDIDIVITQTGAELGQLDALVCLRDMTVYSPAGNVGPVDVGACT